MDKETWAFVLDIMHRIKAGATLSMETRDKRVIFEMAENGTRIPIVVDQHQGQGLIRAISTLPLVAAQHKTLIGYSRIDFSWDNDIALLWCDLRPAQEQTTASAPANPNPTNLLEKD